VSLQFQERLRDINVFISSQYDRARSVSLSTNDLAVDNNTDAVCDSLRAWIDQVERTIFFEGRSQEEEDIQGTAGGLGVERVEKPVQGILLTERWDERIKDTSMKVRFASFSRHLLPVLIDRFIG
jgi:hypothetical protein